MERSCYSVAEIRFAPHEKGTPFNVHARGFHLVVYFISLTAKDSNSPKTIDSDLLATIIVDRR